MRWSVQATSSYLHDPQTAGMVDAMKSTKARVVWRCHIGPRPPLTRSRDLLGHSSSPYIRAADAYALALAPSSGTASTTEKLWVVAPSIDAFSPKNQEMEPGGRPGDPRLRPGSRGGTAAGHRCSSVRTEPQGRVDRRAELDQEGPAPRPKPARRPGLALGPAEGSPRGCCARSPSILTTEAHLLLAGPSVDGVADDPEGGKVLSEIRAQRDALPISFGRGFTSPACRSTTSTRSRDRERDPAPRRRRRPEEHRGRVRAHGGRGDVEGAAGRRQPDRRDPGPDRGRGIRGADRRPRRPRCHGRCDRRPPRRPHPGGGDREGRAGAGAGDLSSAPAT